MTTLKPFDDRPLAALTGGRGRLFDPKWAECQSVIFSALMDWSDHAEEGVKFYSGTAVYRKRFTLPGLNSKSKLFLDLGSVREVAEVRVNGKPCGITWTPPFRVEVTEALKPGANEIEVQVTNFWYNRLVGDRNLPQEKRVTRTNIRKLFNPGRPLMASGLLGPVTLRYME